MKTLSQKVEQSLIFKIRKQERVAGEQGRLVRCDEYLNLANLYEMEHDYRQEVDILERFLNLGLSDESDRDLVETQCSRAKILRHSQRLKEQNHRQHRNKIDPMKSISPELSLQSTSIHPDELSTPKQTPLPVKKNKTQTTDLLEPIAIKKLVVICSDYTGKTSYDEIFGLALISLDYCVNNHVVVKMSRQYEGKRFPHKPISPKTLGQLTESLSELKKCKLDDDLIDRVLREADAVISHNDPFIERQHLVVLYPEFADKPWYSSQLDIPWPAIGFNSRALPDLLGKYQLPLRLHTPLDRAKGIARLLAQVEPETDSTFFDRLLQCQPMKPFQWTDSLETHSKKLGKKSFKMRFFK